MEYNSDNNSSDKDAQMARTFEHYFGVETEKSKEKKSKKKKRTVREGEAAAKSRESDESGSGAAAGAYERENTSETKDGLVAILAKALQKEEGKDDSKADQTTTDKDRGEGDAPRDRVADRGEDTLSVASESEDEPDLPENLEDLSDAELQHVAHHILKARDADLKNELAGVVPDSPEETEALAGAMLIDALMEKLAAGQPISEAVLGSAIREVTEELDITRELAQALPDYTQPVGDADAAHSPEDLARPTPETDTVRASMAAASAVPPEPLRSSGASMGAGSGRGGGAGGGISPLPGGLLATAPGPDIASQPGATWERRRSRGPDLLLGGVIGYLVGRRRGRIKTERRLEPIQKSLERQVKDLHQKITLHEQKVRSLTSEKVAHEGEDARKIIADKLEAKARAKQQAREQERRKHADKQAEKSMRLDGDASKYISEAQVESDRSNRTFASKDRSLVGVAAASAVAGTLGRPGSETQEVQNMNSSLAAEGNGRVGASGHQPERIARVILPVLERSPAAATEDRSQRMYTKEAVDAMPEPQLLSMAARIETGGQSVKSLYEQGRIDKADVRAVVYEQTRGGRPEKLLAEKLGPLSVSETAERLPREFGGPGAPAGGGASGGGPWAPTSGVSTLGASSSRPIDPDATSDALLAQYAAQERKSGYTGAWIAFGVIAAGLIAALILL